jgi:hypothetical protein
VSENVTVSEVARQNGVPPRVISDLFYARRLDDRLCPIVGGRRLIPTHYVPTIAKVLRELQKTEGETSAAPDTRDP